MRALWMLALLGCGQPRTWIDVERVEGTHPEWVILRCRTSGLSKPHFAWKLPGGVRATGIGQPLDEDAVQLQLNDNLRAAEIVECVAGAEAKKGKPPLEVSARVAMGPCNVTAAHLAGSLLTVDGTGFASEGRGDELWLVPARGQAQRADHDCKGGSWSDTRIVACVPSLARKPYQVRVQSAGRLSLGPLVNEPK